MKVVLFDTASVSIELFNDVRLCLMNCIRPWRSRTKFDQMTNVLKRSGTVEASGRGGRRTWQHPRRDRFLWRGLLLSVSLVS